MKQPRFIILPRYTEDLVKAEMMQKFMNYAFTDEEFERMRMLLAEKKTKKIKTK